MLKIMNSNSITYFISLKQLDLILIRRVKNFALINFMNIGAIPKISVS